MTYNNKYFLNKKYPELSKEEFEWLKENRHIYYFNYYLYSHYFNYDDSILKTLDDKLILYLNRISQAESYDKAVDLQTDILQFIINDYYDNRYNKDYFNNPALLYYIAKLDIDVQKNKNCFGPSHLISYQNIFRTDLMDNFYFTNLLMVASIGCTKHALKYLNDSLDDIFIKQFESKTAFDSLRFLSDNKPYTFNGEKRIGINYEYQTDLNINNKEVINLVYSILNKLKSHREKDLYNRFTRSIINYLFYFIRFLKIDDKDVYLELEKVLYSEIICIIDETHSARDIMYTAILGLELHKITGSNIDRIKEIECYYYLYLNKLKGIDLQLIRKEKSSNIEELSNGYLDLEFLFSILIYNIIKPK